MTAMRAKREFSIVKGRKTGSVLDFALDQAYRPPHGSSVSLGISRRPLSPHRPWQCATSHFRATVGLQDTPDWLAVPVVLSLFNDSVSTARTAYRGFVAEGVNQPSPWTHVTSQIFLGARLSSTGSSSGCTGHMWPTSLRRSSTPPVSRRMTSSGMSQPPIESDWAHSSTAHTTMPTRPPSTCCGAPRMNRYTPWPFAFTSPPRASRRFSRRSNEIPSLLNNRRRSLGVTSRTDPVLRQHAMTWLYISVGVSPPTPCSRS